MQRLLAVLLVLIGLIGLVLGRLGETTWAPATETTATVELGDPGAAVVIDPGVLYVGGMEGEVTIEGASDVSLITADNSDIEAYLAETRYTRITGASDWTSLSTQEVNPDGATELSDPTGSDLWRTVDTKPTPYTLDVADFAAGEHDENKQVYRAILIVTDGTAPGADSVTITWPVEDENEWVPFAYAGGAAIAVIGLVLLVVSLGGRRRDGEDEPHELEDGEGSSAVAVEHAGDDAVADDAVADHAVADNSVVDGSTGEDSSADEFDTEDDPVHTVPGAAAPVATADLDDGAAETEPAESSAHSEDVTETLDVVSDDTDPTTDENGFSSEDPR